MGKDIKMSKKKKIILGTTIFLAGSIIIFVLYSQINYSKGKQLINKKDYDKGISYLEKVRYYRDASDILDTDEIKYEKAIILMKKNNYDDAINLFKEISDYKDSKEFIKKEEDYQDAILKDFRISYTGFQNHIVELKKLDNYRDAKQLTKKYEEIASLIKIEEDKVNKVTKEFDKYFGQNGYSSLVKFTLGKSEEYKTYYKEQVDILYSLIDVSEEIMKNSMGKGSREKAISKLSKVNPDLNISEDMMRNIIFALRRIDISEEEWKGVYKSANNGANLNVSPYIGMKKEELKYCTWGKPEDINTTKTKYGTSEQWVFSNNRYVYVENDIVTGIQN